jgi:hypothetical protein
VPRDLTPEAAATAPAGSFPGDLGTEPSDVREVRVTDGARPAANFACTQMVLEPRA